MKLHHDLFRAAANTRSPSRDAIRARVLLPHVPRINRGRREGRMPGRHPWPACKENARGGHHRYGRTPAFPAQWCYGLYVLSLVRRAFWPPSVMGLVEPLNLDISVGMPGPHDFAVRETPLVRASRSPRTVVPRPSHSHPTQLTIRMRPSGGQEQNGNIE